MNILQGTKRTWVAALAGLWLCVSGVACHRGGGGSDEDRIAFRCSDSPAAVDAVVIRCGQLTSRDVWKVRVAIGGATSSSDIMGFNFDVVFDSTDLTYVDNSAVQGALLNSDGDTPLLVAEVASNDPGRLLVGIHRASHPNGVKGTAAENLILEFSMKANVLTNFGPALLQFENAEAVDSSGSVISGITFSDQLLLSVQ